MKALLKCPKCGALVYTDKEEFQCKLCGNKFTNESVMRGENPSPLEKQYYIWTLLMDSQINKINDEEWE